MNLKDIISVSEKLETPFFAQRQRSVSYLNQQLKRGTPGLDAWLIKNPYLTLAEMIALVSPPIKAGRKFWFQPGSVVFRGCFSNKPGLRKVFRKL